MHVKQLSLTPKEYSILGRLCASQKPNIAKELLSFYLTKPIVQPEKIQEVTSWEIKGTGDTWAVNSWGGHAVAIVGAHENYFEVITWDKTLLMSEEFYKAYNDESYVVFSRTDWIKPDKTSPAVLTSPKMCWQARFYNYPNMHNQINLVMSLGLFYCLIFLLFKGSLQAQSAKKVIFKSDLRLMAN